MTERQASAGLLASLRRLGATTLELARLRLELLGTEIERQKLSVLSALLWAALGSVCVALGLVLTSAVIVVLFWDSYRLQAIVGLPDLLRRRRADGALCDRPDQTPSGAFAASREELARDRAALDPREAAAPPPDTSRR
jgi:uncharacterized membrane protein YqjE